MRLPSRHDFVQFDSALETLANNWPGLSEEELKAKTMTPYQLTAEKIIDYVEDKERALHPKLTNDHARHGALTMGRYCNVAALVANREEMDKVDLAEMLRNPASFRVLSRIASTQSEVAIKIENTLGIRGYYLEDELAALKLRHWVVGSDGELIVAGMDQIIYESVLKTAEDRKLDLSPKKHECSALSNKVLGKICHEFTAICMQDPLLFDRTLSGSYRFAAV